MTLFGKLTQGCVILAFHQAAMHGFVSTHFKPDKHSLFTWHHWERENSFPQSNLREAPRFRTPLLPVFHGPGTLTLVNHQQPPTEGKKWCRKRGEICRTQLRAAEEAAAARTCPGPSGCLLSVTDREDLGQTDEGGFGRPWWGQVKGRDHLDNGNHHKEKSNAEHAQRVGRCHKMKSGGAGVELEDVDRPRVFTESQTGSGWKGH